MAKQKREPWYWKGIKVYDYDFPKSQYYQDLVQKKRIDLHHMASGESLIGDIDWWLATVERVATCLGINRDGSIGTLFESENWAHALGIKIREFDKFDIKRIYRTRTDGSRYVANNEILNQESIQCELDSWGRLNKKGLGYYSWNGKKIDSGLIQVYDKGFKGSNYFEKYTDEAIRTLEELLYYWNDKYGIDIGYKGDIIFKQNKRALLGEPGLWTHGSYRTDKDDLHPQPELIQMLDSLPKLQNLSA